MGYDKFHNKSGLARSRGSIASGVIAKDGFSLDGPPTRPYSAIRADKADGGLDTVLRTKSRVPGERVSRKIGRAHV